VLCFVRQYSHRISKRQVRQLKEIDMINKKNFTTLAAANKFADTVEDSAQYLSITGSDDCGWIVSFGTNTDTRTELQALNDMFNAEEREAGEKKSADCSKSALEQVGAEIAAEAGHSGQAARQFTMGFAGYSAKFADPRACGLEPVFRAGRAARQTPDCARRVRARTALIFHNTPAVHARPLNYVGSDI
jgi:hypothetical protein